MTFLLLEPLEESFSEKRINLTNEVLKIGRYKIVILTFFT